MVARGWSHIEFSSNGGVGDAVFSIRGVMRLHYEDHGEGAPVMLVHGFAPTRGRIGGIAADQVFSESVIA